MAHYWLTFRIHDDAGYPKRYDGMIGAINDLGAAFWEGPTSFIAMESESAIGTIALRVKQHLGRSDLFLIRELGKDNSRYIGSQETASNTSSPTQKGVMHVERHRQKAREGHYGLNA